MKNRGSFDHEQEYIIFGFMNDSMYTQLQTPVVTRFEPIWIQDCFVSSSNVGWAYVPWMVLYVTSKKGEYGELKWVSPYLLNIPDLDCCELMQVLTDEKVVERSSGEYTKVPGLGDGRNDEL